MQPTPTLSPILYLVTLTADCGNHSRDLVARNHGEDGAGKLTARLMNIGMTDSAKLDVDGNIVLAYFAPFESVGCEWRLSGGSSVAFGFDHEVSFSRHGMERGPLILMNTRGHDLVTLALQTIIGASGRNANG